MVNKKEVYNKIGASLKHGIVFKTPTFIFMYVFLAVCLIDPIWIIVFLSLVVIGQKTISYEDILPLICSFVTTSLIGVGVIVVITKKHLLKRRIFLWLDDAVERKATTTTVDMYRYPIRANVKLKVKFNYNNKKYIFISGDSTKSRILGNGYNKIFAKYADREIKIFYSPKYDEVLLLKDDC